MYGHISGAHINPSVTIAAWIMKEIEFYLVPIYFLAQFSGALVGFGILMVSSTHDYSIFNYKLTFFLLFRFLCQKHCSQKKEVFATLCHMKN